MPESSLRVVVPLRVACVGVSCDTRSTCVSGACRSASLDASRCRDSGCNEDALGPSEVDGGAPDVAVASDSGLPSACADDEKVCHERCVKKHDPLYGCSDTFCSVCAGVSVALVVCDQSQCSIKDCAPGYKRCGENCVPTDPQHGCRSTSCAPCDSANGIATCDSTGACRIACENGTKLCDGKCVRSDDPTYGCTPAGCSAESCPDASGGTVVCSAGACVVGECGSGTKKCAAKCVPVDANNGCENPSSCAACGPGEVCTGTPTACTCVREALSTTCATRACGAAVNNCGDTVECPNTCASGTVCGGGGAGANQCGCAPDNTAACAGKACGPAVNNCGQTITCPNTCVAPKTCGGGGAGANGCGCTPIPKSEACFEPCGVASNGCGGYYNCGNICR